MAEARLLQSNFTGGELSDQLIASGDLQRYQWGLQRALNTIIHPPGGAEKRSGSIWAADPPVTTQTGRLLGFIRNVSDAVIVLVQNSKLRFWTVATRAPILSGMSPLEVACPWSDADLDHLRTWQSGDVLYIADARATGALRSLRRTAPDAFTLATVDYREGPWAPDIAGVSADPSGVTGSITVHFSGNVLNAGDVGRLIRFRENNGASPYKRWESGATIGAGEKRANGGRVYVSSAGGTAGNNSPIHDAGTVSDGGVDWTFVHDGAGVAIITAVTDGDDCSATVLTELPSNLATPYWSFGAFSTTSGHPITGTTHQERMALAGATQTPDTTYLSRVGGYGPTHGDFKPGLGTGLIVDSDAVTRALASGNVETIRHLVSMERLYAFTDDAVHRIGGPSIDEPLAPADAAAREQSAFGAARETAPVKAGDAILYAGVGQQELFEIVTERRETPSLSLLADHIARRRFAELAFAKAPVPCLFARLADGGLATMTYKRNEEVKAWASQALAGGEIVSIVRAPKPDGRDEIWIYVRRTIDGAARYSIEILPPPWDRNREPLEMACALDAAGFLDLWNTNGANQATLTVLDYEARRARVDVQSASFAGGDIGKTVALRLEAPANGVDPGANAAIARVKIDTFTDDTTIEGVIESDGPEALDGTATTLWALMTDTLTGLSRLEGQTIDCFMDGEPIRGLVVDGGEVALPHPVARGWVGLPFDWDIIDMPAAAGVPNGTALALAKRITRAWAITRDATAGLKIVGRHHEDELIVRDGADENSAPPMPRTGFLRAIDPNGWNEAGQIRLRHSEPTPFQLLGIVKEVMT